MKIITVTYQKTFSIGPFLTDRVGAEISLEEGESVMRALDSTKKIIEEWHKEANPHLYSPEQHIVPTPSSAHIPKEINLKDEQTEISIENASSIQELEPLKAQCHTMTLLKKYQVKLKQLTNP